MRPQDVVNSVEPERWDAILTAVREHSADLWRDLEKAAMADQRVPPKLWQRYSVEQRRATIRRALRAPASARLALDAVREYLLAAQRPMLVRFLDELGVEHEEGALDEEPLAQPEPARLDAAVDVLLAEFPRPDVVLYLRTFAAHENTPWPRLNERLATLEAAPEHEPPPEGPSGGGGGGERPSARPAGRAAPPAAQPTTPPPSPPPSEPPPARSAGPPTTGARPAPQAPRATDTAAERGGSAGRQRPPPPPDETALAQAAAPPPRDLPGADLPPAVSDAAGGLSTPDHTSAQLSAPSPALSNPSAAGTPLDTAQSNGGRPASDPVAAEPGSPSPEPPPGRAVNLDPPPSTASRARSRSTPAPAPAATAAALGGVRDPAAESLMAAVTPSANSPADASSVPERAGEAGPGERVWPRPAPAAPAAEPGAHDQTREETGPDRLTPLDRLLWRTAVATLSGVRGAPAEDELWTIVDEVLHLSARRPQTYYHVGLLEVLTGTARELDRRGWSPARWDWYHYGRLVAWTRQQRWPEIARFYAEERAAARRLLRGPEEMAPWAAPLLFDGLLAADAPSQAADVLLQFSGMAPLEACGALLDAANTRLEENRAPEAYEILDVLELLHPLAPAPPSLDEPRPDPVASYRRRLRRVQAQAAQAQGLFATARARLEAELASVEGVERAELLGDLGLVAGEFGRLAELRLPEADAEPQSWIRRLEAGAPAYEQAVEIAPYRSPAASFALGALQWLRERPSLARRHFEAALQAMQERRELYRRIGALAQVQFYLGATLLLELDAPARDRAVGLLREALAAGVRASETAWGRLLDTVTLDPALAPALFDVFSQQDPPPRRELAQVFLVRCAARSEAARARLARESAREDLPATQRWELLTGLLEAERRSGTEEAARDTLDRLETLAHAPIDASRQLLERWRAFLARPENYEPIWSAEDVLWSRVRTLELLGRDDEAFWLLDMPFNRLLAEATPEALANAEALLARARTLGTSAEARVALQEMAVRLRARQDTLGPDPKADAERVAAQLRAGRSLRVLFLGGNETQERHEQELRRALTRRDETTGAEIALSFLYPSFNSNWDKALESVRGLRGRLDALVLMPFVRTELGRAVRRLCSEFGIPWVACTGKGYDSMERALRTALELAAERPPPNRGVRRAS